jgi:hypothetical protein
METKFIIDPANIEKLRERGLATKIEKLVKDDSCEYMRTGAVFSSDISSIIKEMNLAGYFMFGPQGSRNLLNSKLSDMLDSKSAHPWRINKPEGLITKDTNSCDLLLFTGFHAYCVLEIQDFWNFKKFGFDTFAEFWGSIGIHMTSFDMDDYSKSYKFNSQINNTQFEVEVGATMHGDLHIRRTNLTQYPCTDPLGFNVGYRPITPDDTTGIAAWHSTEPQFLATLLKYIDQLKIPSVILKDQGKQMIAEFLEQDTILGNYADAGHERMGDSPRFVLMNYMHPIPEIGSKAHSPFCIGVSADSTYATKIENGNLAFVYVYKGKPDSDRKFIIYPSEVDHFLKGIFHQAAHGDGRTSFFQLQRLLEYRFSDQFEIDQKEDKL